MTLDRAGDLACANAELAQDSVLEGDLEQALLDVEAAAQRAADPLGAVQTFLAVCTDHGYEL